MLEIMQGRLTDSGLGCSIILRIAIGTQLVSCYLFTVNENNEFTKFLEVMATCKKEKVYKALV